MSHAIPVVDAQTRPSVGTSRVSVRTSGEPRIRDMALACVLAVPVMLVLMVWLHGEGLGLAVSLAVPMLVSTVLAFLILSIVRRSRSGGKVAA